MAPVVKLLELHLSKVGAIANNGRQQMTMFQQGEIAVFMASTGNVARLKSLGVPCEFVHPVSGSPSVPVTIHLAKNAANPDGVYQYMDAAIPAEAQAKLALPPTEMIPTNLDVPLTPRHQGVCLGRADEEARLPLLGENQRQARTSNQGVPINGWRALPDRATKGNVC